MKIGELDSNLKVETKLTGVDGIVFRDVCDAPFELFGLWKPEKGKPFCRMDPAVAEKVSGGVACLNYHTAGGRVRFSTDSEYIAVSAVYPGLNQMPHMTLCGQAGFDLYEDKAGTSVYIGTFMPGIDAKTGYESVLHVGNEGMRHYTVNFPLYNGVNSLYIGLQGNAEVDKGLAYRYDKPVLYYGSSITQGGCAARAGLSYQGMISRLLSVDHINLGFSGNGRGEKPMQEYLASLDPCIFVLDYDYNANTNKEYEETHEPLFRTFREKHPDTPVIFVTRPQRPDYPVRTGSDRRDIALTTYRNAINGQDKNVAYIDGLSFFSGPFGDCATVDNCHPNTYGFVRMAETIGQVVAGFLR